MVYSKATPLSSISGHITADAAITPGRVTLLDFWNYSRVNCLRDLPFLNALHDAYSSQGLDVVGVHSPEFGFEKDYSNVLKAVMQYEVKYPVLLDNGLVNWRNYKNVHRPQKHLIDKDGFLRYSPSGEGAFEQLETKVAELLKEISPSLQTKPVNAKKDAIDFTRLHTPEFLFGHQFRKTRIANAQDLMLSKTFEAKMPSLLTSNNVYLDGTWKNNLENIELESTNGSIAILFDTKSVNLVAEGDAIIDVFIDGKLAKKEEWGKDVNNSAVRITDARLYSLIRGNYGANELKLVIKGKIRVYALSFG